ncbi:HMG-box [Epithele typhae]|uniref:HMG-box n=1 Tax=Epithele typhae TaxID=378194 RepID=UPI0020075F83|nr:HMG-box [Epithele typhae]KAH9942985.1 HMG-box [Epithele typhae]
MSPESHAQFEYQKMQLIGSLNNMANNMRDCAAAFDQFSQIVGGIPWNGNPTSFPALANGQFPMQVMQPMTMTQDENGKKRKSRGDDGDVKRRQPKKLKDPNAPKRPASSYLLFQNDIRSELKAKHPQMRNNELLSAIAKLWADMPQSEKDEYEARNRAAKDNWLAQKKIYEAGLAGPSAAPAVVATPVKVAVPVPAVAAAVVTPTEAEDDDSDEEDDDGSSDDESSDEVQVTAPPLKKNKKEETPVKEESKKEKKHKKAKA